MRFADDFLCGAASSATQVEGGDRNNTWYAWCHPERIADGSDCLRAADHWNRFEEDFSILADLGLQCYRMGLEWSRIEPAPGAFSDEAIAHYRRMILSLREKGIRPLVTLHHFSLPLWLDEIGGFENREAIEHFDRYVAFVVENIGDIVSEYITINEPNVYTANGYFLGIWPPGKKHFFKALKVYRHLAIAHFRAYMTIHDIRDRMIDDAAQLGSALNGAIDSSIPPLFSIEPETKVGVAHHVQIFEPYRPKNPFDHIAAAAMRLLFQNAIMDSMTTGWLRFPIGRGNPCKLEDPSDFLALNYYTRSGVHAAGFRLETLPDKHHNDLGWEVYPQGLYDLIRSCHERYRLPIWITENGCSDADDAFRARFLRDHLEAIARAQSEGIPVERYYHWASTDNFEWLEGEGSRFGLIHIDYESQQRTPKDIARYYAAIIAHCGTSPEIDDDFGVNGQRYENESTEGDAE